MTSFRHKCILAAILCTAVLAVCLVSYFVVRQPCKGSVASARSSQAQVPDAPLPGRDNLPGARPVAQIDSANKRRAWIDSLDRIVRKGLPPYSDLNHREKGQVAYIRACGLLGNYYMGQYNQRKLPGLQKALKYYLHVMKLSDGTDGSLGNGEKAITERNRVCYRVAALYNSGKLDIKHLKSMYAGHYIDPMKINLHNSFKGRLTDSCKATIRFIPGNYGLTKDAQQVLKVLMAQIRQHPESKIVVSTGGYHSEFGQQIGWDQVNAVIEYLVGRYSLDRMRFIFQYWDDDAPDRVALRFASPGEDGPALVPPPHPYLHDNAYWRH